MGPLASAALAEGVTQLSLALFTTATTGGIVACLIVVCYVLAHHRDAATCVRLQRFLIIPLAAVIIGLIASTTHLGRPSNTLYVLMGVGRSPLSNEVVAVVAFTGLAWLGWLLSFARGRLLGVARALLVVSLPAGAFAIFRIASAYSIATIITWALPYTQVNLMLVGLVSGPVLALLLFAAAGVAPGRLAPLGMGVSLVAAVCLTVSEALQCLTLRGLESGLYPAADLVPFYPGCIAASAVLIAAALAVLALPLIRRAPLGIGRCAGATALVFAGIFIVRFAFYCMRLTAGI
ncbi:MAG: dimethyl sulfoxide reductase anchor subunit [Eggerthellaceae bacterium]|nr:dimethyl sulfoxide reductase anchor subunit [Eggerthellaceae bacterium]